MGGEGAKQDSTANSELPFLAPCRTLTTRAPFRWIQKGFRDLVSAPLVSLTCGFLMAVPIIVSLLLAWQYGSAWIVFSLLIGFVFAAPLGCITTYAVSAQLERGLKVSFSRTLRATFSRYTGTLMVFALVLLIIFLLWARAGSMVSIFVPETQAIAGSAMLPYGLALAAVSLLFLSITFAISMFSLPMIMHRDVDAITALITSVNAVLRNKLVMLLWAGLLVAGLVLGVLAAGVGLILVLPLIGHATWHAYLETIDPALFPRHEFGITATARLHD